MPASADPVNDSLDVDVLVTGAGGCGLAEAVAAHEQGASVAILEKAERFQGNTTLSSGSIPAAGTRFQRAAGLWFQHRRPVLVLPFLTASRCGCTEIPITPRCLYVPLPQ